MRTTNRSTRRSRRNDADSLLKNDVAAMIRDARETGAVGVGVGDEELAHDIVTVVRERVLREIESLARENIR